MTSVYFHTGRSWLLVGKYCDEADAARSAEYVLWHRRQAVKFMGHYVESIKIEDSKGAEYV